MRKLWAKTPDWARLLIFLALLGGTPLTLGFIDDFSRKLTLSRCNDGKIEACENVSYLYIENSGITNKEFIEKEKAAKEAQKQKNIKEREEKENYLASNPKALVQSVVDKHEISMRWGCEDAIKKQLKDPRSYKAVKVTYFPHTMNEHPQAVVDTRISFRSKNSFGGYADAFARCAFNRNGEMVRSPNVVSGL